MVSKSKPRRILSKTPSKYKQNDVDIWNDQGSPFGSYQIQWFLVSDIGLILYFLHFWCSKYNVAQFPLIQRTTLDAALEVIVLIGRGLNEIKFGKWGGADVLHHSSVLMGAYLVFYVDSCKPYAWLVCQLNILHFPMYIWYLGCRQGCYSSNSKTKRNCRLVFPNIWLISTAYRTSCMVSSSLNAFSYDNFIPGLLLTVFACVLAYLDREWTSYFFSELEVKGISVAQALFYILGLVSGVLTVFYL